MAVEGEPEGVVPNKLWMGDVSAAARSHVLRDGICTYDVTDDHTTSTTIIMKIVILVDKSRRLSGIHPFGQPWD